MAFLLRYKVAALAVRLEPVGSVGLVLDGAWRDGEETSRDGVGQSPQTHARHGRRRRGILTAKEARFLVTNYTYFIQINVTILKVVDSRDT